MTGACRAGEMTWPQTPLAAPLLLARCPGTTRCRLIIFERMPNTPNAVCRTSCFLSTATEPSNFGGFLPSAADVQLGIDDFNAKYEHTAPHTTGSVVRVLEALPRAAP